MWTIYRNINFRFLKLKWKAMKEYQIVLYLLRMLEQNNSGWFFWTHTLLVCAWISSKKFGWFCSEMTRAFFSVCYMHFIIGHCGFHMYFNLFIILSYMIQFENVALRPRNINWQDWKYPSFVIFIGHSQNTRRHSAMLVAVVVENIEWKFPFQSWVSILLCLRNE